jgi:glycine/D-amino acid oxidase-like deaminating enzyme/nitrite reductase/ring-hydroxylating ferredoxin subunit
MKRGEELIMEKASLWKKEATAFKSFPKLDENKDTDVVVIGGGITGLTTALLLTDAGKKVILLEALNIGDGTTGFSSCHLTTDLDEEYQNIASDFDEDIMRLVADSRKAGINFIEKTCRSKNIACDFQRVPGYLFTEMAEDVSRLKDEFEFASLAGLNVSLTDNLPLSFGQRKALKFENQAQFNAQKYLNGIAAYLRENGCGIFENSRVSHVEEKDDYFWVRTSSAIVKAKNLVMATHTPVFFNVLQAVIAPYRSYVMAAKLNSGNYPEGLFWDTAEPYHYIRTYESNENKYLVVGGEDHKTGHEENSEKNFQRLEKYIRERFDVQEISFRWSGQYYEPADGLPYIGRSPFSRKSYLATGFSGDGLVYGTIAGLIISDLIMGKENKWEEAYDSTRLTPAASAYDFIKENTDVVKHYVADRIKAEAKELSEVKPGEGKIVTLDGQKIAASRDENGGLNACSPSCPHMGCFVKWNNSEKSWDCPCHGSRFNNKGEVIYGPAVKSLGKVTVEYDAEKKKEKIKK